MMRRAGFALTRGALAMVPRVLGSRGMSGRSVWSASRTVARGGLAAEAPGGGVVGRRVSGGVGVGRLACAKSRASFGRSAWGASMRGPSSTTVTQSRGMSTGVRELEQAARKRPTDAAAQAAYLTVLNRTAPREVIAWVQHLETTGSRALEADGVLIEYVRALVRTRSLTPERFREVFRLWSKGSGAGTGTGAAVSGGLGGEALMAGAVRGTAENPVFTQALAEPFSVGKLLRLLLVVFLVTSVVGGFIRSSAGGGARGMPGGGKTDFMVEGGDALEVTFADVEGVEEAKEELEDVVAFLRDPSGLERLGARMPKGILLVGDPGTGKTLLARAVAGESGCAFLYASGAEFDEMFVGVGARRVKTLFEQAKEHAPCIIFIDEIDAVGARRGSHQQAVFHQTLNQLLTEMDGFRASEDSIIVIAATNAPEQLDKALVRPGRFDRQVVVPLPDVSGREAILKLHLGKVVCGSDIDASAIARGTPGASGADLANLVNIAAISATKDDREEVLQCDLEEAKEKVVMGAAAKTFGYSDRVKEIVAFHEGGHALVSLLTPEAIPLHKATIIPRRSVGALGLTLQLPENDDPNWTRGQLLARLDVALGGRVAEEVIFGEEAVTLGASSDFEAATAIATAMVTRYGMSPKVGPMFIANLEKASEPLQALVEEEIRRLLSESHERVRSLLRAKRWALKRIAQALLDKESLAAAEIEQLVRG